MKPQIHGLLFTTDFLNEGIRQTPDWNASENDFIIFRDEIKKIFSTAQNNTVLNEAQTEDEFILPVIKALGWNTHSDSPKNGRKQANSIEPKLTKNPRIKRVSCVV